MSKFFRRRKFCKFTAEGVTDIRGNFHFDLRLKDHFVGHARTKGDASITLEATVVHR